MAAKSVIQETPKKKDPWTIMENVYIPRPRPGESNVLYVSINKRKFSVPKGKATLVPRPVAQVIRHSLKAEEATDAYITSIRGLDHKL